MKKQYKICVLTYGKLPVPATSGGAVENLMEMMMENYSSDCGCSFDFISVHTDEAQEKSKQYKDIGFRYVSYKKSAKKIYKQIKRFSKKLFGYTPVMLDPYFKKAAPIIKKGNYDAVMLENCPDYTAWVRRHTDCKVIFHLHNDLSNFYEDYAGIIAKNSHLVITVSDYVSGGVRSAKNCNVPVVTVRNVIDTSRFAAHDDEEKVLQKRNELGFTDDDVVFIFAGRIIPEKGVDKLIEAMGKVKCPNIKLVVAGGSAYSQSQKSEFEEKLHETAKKLGNKVLFTGYIDYSQLPMYYRAADCAVFPSVWEEAAGLVLIEAQSAAKPVITARSGGMPEYVCKDSAIVVDKGEKFTDDLASAMDTLASDAALRERMGQAAAQFAKGFDKDGYCEMLADAIKRVLD